MQLQTVQYGTFRRYARNFLEPAIIHKWNRDQEHLIRQLKERGKLAIAGDMRADSPGRERNEYFNSTVYHNIYGTEVLNNVIPMIMILFSIGHSAKYGSYTLMDMETKSIVDLQLIQVNNSLTTCNLFFNPFTFIYQFISALLCTY